MKKILLPLLSLSLTIVFSCTKTEEKKVTSTESTEENPALAEGSNSTMSQDELIAKGEHLVITSGCDDCHSPKKYNKGMPEADKDRRLSGHPADLKLAPYDAKTIKNGWSMTNQHFTAWVGPWGVSFSSNITSDKATGIGNWTEEQFFTAIREGKYHGLKDGRMMLPPMPWPNFAKFTDDELKAIFTYLKSVPAVNNAVPAPIPPKKS